MRASITFMYTPQEPDDASATGMSEDESTRLTQALENLGAYDISMEAIPFQPPPNWHPPDQ
jgi:hypothetical protein